MSNFKYVNSLLGLSRKELGEILGLFAIWRILLFFVALFGVGRFPVPYNFYGKGAEIDLFKAWANWDGAHYLAIAQRGYEYSLEFAFFPLYPFLIKLSSFLTLGDYFWAAYLVSAICTIASLIFLYKLIKLKYDGESGFRGLFYILVFPTSFYLVAAYSESVFLFFSVAAYFFSIQKNWGWGCFFAMLAVITRPMGIILVLALLIEYLLQVKFDLKKMRRDVLWFLITPLGLFWYMFELYQKFKDPLFFIRVQTFWHRSGNFINPLEVLTKNWTMLIKNFSDDYYNFITLSTDYFFTALFLAAAPIIYFKVNKSMGIYVLLMTLLPISSGSLASQSRFVLVLFPFFILLAKWGENRLVNFAVMIFGALFLGIFAILFINGHWLA